MPTIDWNTVSVVTLLGLTVTAFLRGWVVARPIMRVILARLEESERDRRSLIKVVERLAK
jgi:hypothetical protein